MDVVLQQSLPDMDLFAKNPLVGRGSLGILDPGSLRRLPPLIRRDKFSFGVKDLLLSMRATRFYALCSLTDRQTDRTGQDRTGRQDRQDRQDRRNKQRKTYIKK